MFCDIYIVYIPKICQTKSPAEPWGFISSSDEIDKDDKDTNFKGKEMSKDLSFINLIRLDTELENAIGFREAALKAQDMVEYIVWDNEMMNIIKEIETLGDWYEN